MKTKEAIINHIQDARKKAISENNIYTLKIRELCNKELRDETMKDIGSFMFEIKINNRFVDTLDELIMKRDNINDLVLETISKKENLIELLNLNIDFNRSFKTPSSFLIESEHALVVSELKFLIYRLKELILFIKN